MTHPQFVIFDEATIPWWGRLEGEEERNVEQQPKPVKQSKRVGRMKRDAHKVIHKAKIKKKNRAKNRVAKAARKAGRR